MNNHGIGATADGHRHDGFLHRLEFGAAIGGDFEPGLGEELGASDKRGSEQADKKGFHACDRNVEAAGNKDKRKCRWRYGNPPFPYFTLTR
jgi:hypothetical protein